MSLNYWIPNKFCKMKVSGNYCCICINEIKIGEYYRKLVCNHIFHKKCVDKWLILDVKNRCPMCRHDNGTKFHLAKKFFDSWKKITFHPND